VGHNSLFREEIKQISLSTGTTVEVEIIIVGALSPLDPPLDDRPVREGEFDLSGIPPRVQIDEISQTLCAKRPGGGEGKDKKDAVYDIALPGAVWSGDDGKPG